jgi:hypothetical protein
MASFKISFLTLQDTFPDKIGKSPPKTAQTQTWEKMDGSHCYGGIGVPLNGNGIKSFQWKGWIVAGLTMEWRDGSLSTISLPIYSPRKCCNMYLYVNLALIFVLQAAGLTDTPTSGPLRPGSILPKSLQKEDLLLLAPLDLDNSSNSQPPQ